MAAITAQPGQTPTRFGYEIVLGSAYRGHADVGEVLSTAARVKDGDADAWVRCT